MSEHTYPLTIPDQVLTIEAPTYEDTINFPVTPAILRPGKENTLIYLINYQGTPADGLEGEGTITDGVYSHPFTVPAAMIPTGDVETGTLAELEDDWDPNNTTIQITMRNLNLNPATATYKDFALTVGVASQNLPLLGVG